ncbi:MULTISPECIES: glycoside hydrolase family 3 N-terminal domain-containing protein [unclassified Streptomyces]|uniref:beta-xylosidase/alpha-l-arabinosidase n=1 Tax=unclassified Streptomyces TaxID=2593676 RepID=UPI00336ACD93
MSAIDDETAGLGRGRTEVRELIAAMTLEEKLAQLVGLWQGVDREGGAVAPLQDAMDTVEQSFADFAAHGLGQITRHYGTRPLDPREGRATLAAKQRWLKENTRLGIPAIVHEECLTGLAAWKAATYPVPPAWGATFDPPLVERMAARIGRTMAGLGIHQGLAPVLDVIRDMRWGRVEECISEDPYHVAVTGAAYVRGLQSAGIIATLKHFVGYSNSRAGRNLAPVHAGPREVRDVLEFPFEVAVRDAGARSVMNSYAEIDGVPVAASTGHLTGTLREEWGFTGTVVADYFAVAFLQTLHKVAEDGADAAAQAITAGIDVELPTGVTYLQPLKERIEDGRLGMDVVDRALERVLRQKAELGLLDPQWSPEPAPADGAPAGGAPADAVDTEEDRALAAAIAERSLVLLRNDGVLPLGATRAAPARIAVIGPNARSRSAMFGCYSFVNHVLPHHPDHDTGLGVETVEDALRREFPDADIVTARGTGVDDGATDGIPAAATAAAGAEVAVVVVGDRSGLFGRGTSGEGCDADDLELPGAQRELVEAVLATGTPTVVVLLTGRGYALGWLLDTAAAVVQAFFPGEEGAAAIAGVLSGRINPSGRMPMSLPRGAGAQPYSYLHPPLGAASSVTNIDTEPPVRYGFGLSYTRFAYEDLTVDVETVDVADAIRCAVTVRNAGDREGAEVVQLYANDPVASVTRPLAQLVAFARVPLAPGQSARVHFTVPTRLLAFTGRDGVRIVEPGDIGVSVRRDAGDVILEHTVRLTGDVHIVTGAEPRISTVDIS